MRRGPQPSVPVLPESAALGGGLDLISGPGLAKIGTARFSSNYEPEFGGGYRRIGGVERYSGQPRPSDAQHVLLELTGGFTGALGNTVTGVTSAATGRVVYISADTKKIGLTRITGGPFVTEALNVGGIPKGTVTDDQPEIDGFLDNEIAALAAASYRADIAALPGTGPVRGVAILNDLLYAWRDNAGALVTYKESVAGWVVVPLAHEVSFTAGSVAYTDGSSLVQGGNSAVVTRVVLETGSWGAGTAAGRLVLASIVGTFAAGAAAGTGVATLAGAQSAITMAAGGRVRARVDNFTASLNTRRLYCCDGVNREFEFDGTTIVPINTGMGSVRATDVRIHKNHLFFLYRGGLQHSGLGLPYQWSPVVGAGELGTGDIGSDLIGVGGSESNAALMVICRDSVWVLYGNSEADWDFRKISDEAGGQQYAAQEVGSPITFDRDGFIQYRPTDSYGNFNYDSASRQVDPLVRNALVKSSVLVKNKNRYRCFFNDGLFLSGTPSGKGISWMPCNYGRVIECAVGGEIDGQYRVFYGDSNGWVLEADVGRSFDGDEIEAYMRLSSSNQKSSVTLKQYRYAELETETESAFALAVGAEFSDSDPDIAAVTAETMTNFVRQYGNGLFYDFNSWDRAYWDVALVSRARYPITGQGRSLALLVQSVSANELPHTIKSRTVLYSLRRLAR